MDPETWKCPKCGEEIEAQFDACWNCGAFRYEHEPPRPREVASPEKMLSEILRLQREQNTTLSHALYDIQHRVGCLYYYMWFGIVVGVISVWVFFLIR